MATIINVKVESKIKININAQELELDQDSAKVLCESLMEILGINKSPIQYIPYYPTIPTPYYQTIPTIMTDSTEPYVKCGPDCKKPYQNY